MLLVLPDSTEIAQKANLFFTSKVLDECHNVQVVGEAQLHFGSHFGKTPFSNSETV